MEKTLQVINQMEQEKIISRYAIGGAVAAPLYIEPIQTYDLDVFILFPSTPSGLISLTPIYNYLEQHGYRSEGETILIEGWPVQFLPVYNPLTEEALTKAEEVTFGTIATRVLRAEYLATIMLEVGRAKDHARLVQFFEYEVLNQKVFLDIVTRYGLVERWDKFYQRFLKEG